MTIRLILLALAIIAVATLPLSVGLIIKRRSKK